MKKPLKIILISLTSLLGLLVVAVCILMWLVLTPARLTPIVNKAVTSFVKCPTHFENVELTFFSTFPQVALHVENLSLVNPMPGAPSDTLACVRDVEAVVNIRKLLKEDVLEVKKLYLKEGTASLYVAADGRQNFDVFVTDTTDTTSSAFPFDWISAEKLSISHFNVGYTDDVSHMQVRVEDFNTDVKASLSEDSFDGNVKINLERLFFHLSDSTEMKAALQDVSMKLKGAMDGKVFSGSLQCEMPMLDFEMDSLHYAETASVRLALPLTYNMENRSLSLDKAEVGLDDFLLTLNGRLQSEDTTFAAWNCDVDYALKTFPVTEALPWVEKFAPGLLEGMDIDGYLTLDGNVHGKYADSLMPQITANVLLKHGSLEAQELLPVPVKNIVADARVTLDLNNENASWVDVHDIMAETGKSKVQLKGSVRDIFNRVRCDVLLTGKMHLPDVEPFFPDDLPLDVKGSVRPNLKVCCNLDDLLNVDLQKIQAKGTLSFQELDADYDSLLVKSDALALDIQLPSPNKAKNKQFKEILQAKIHADGLQLKTGDLHADAGTTALTVGLSDVMDTTRLLSLVCDFDFSSLDATLDTLLVGIRHPKGSITMRPSAKDVFSPAFAVNYGNQALSLRMGSFLKTVAQAVSISGDVTYDSLQKNVLEQWNPHLNVKLSKATVGMDMLPDEVGIPDVNFSLNPSDLDLKSGRFVLGNSEFNLSGKVKHLSEFLNDEALLKADFDFVSDYVDVNYIMDFFSGMNLGTDSVAVVEEPVAKEDNPFMVPLGMDVTLNTKASKLLVGETIIDNLGGQLTVHDGTLVLEEMGFTCDAARMQLTAMYKSPRKNHLFAYVDFHLMDINIADLIEMIPDIDTIVPMLKTFAGKAEFHFAAQTNLKSNYDIKYSTLRGAASISGKDLVVLDNETFSTIAKYLMFDKKTENKVDSISVEMAVFQKNVDLYPFLLSMDDYHVIASGHYVIDQNYNCHLSLVKSPLPARLGLNVYGNAGKLQYKLEKPQYVNLFKPEKQNVVENETMKLKQMIASSLKANVKEP